MIKYVQMENNCAINLFLYILGKSKENSSGILTNQNETMLQQENCEATIVTTLFSYSQSC